MKKRIMVVEDDHNISSFIILVLEDEGYEVLHVENVASALAFIGKENVDLALLDRNLPDGNGLEICRAIREKPSGSAIPVMFITGEKTLDDIADGLEGGADDYLIKPFSRDQLLTRVQALMSLNRTKI